MVILDIIHVIKKRLSKFSIAIKYCNQIANNKWTFSTTQTLCICNVSVMYIGIYICDMLTVNLVHM